MSTLWQEAWRDRNTMRPLLLLHLCTRARDTDGRTWTSSDILPAHGIPEVQQERAAALAHESVFTEMVALNSAMQSQGSAQAHARRGRRKGLLFATKNNLSGNSVSRRPCEFTFGAKLALVTCVCAHSGDTRSHKKRGRPLGGQTAVRRRSDGPAKTSLIGRERDARCRRCSGAPRRLAVCSWSRLCCSSGRGASLRR